jgi:DNA invertase Pin-like site-specific DNA recombinase
MKTAVMYLRVSTTGQVETDYDPEGISIPAQRAACLRKAEQMGVMVVDEFVEPGRSATTIEKRPVFQQMLERIKTQQDVDYVIVYNLSRLNRNRVDDAKVLMTRRVLKVTLISAQENIDETPAGQLMHGILAAFNEYRSMADGVDIRYKMGQKVKNGGTIGRAKLGYLNVRDHSAGREVRTIAVDPERANYIQLAFELYATGEYSLERLARTLTDRGLRTRGFGRFPAGPISTSQLAVILRDRYYLGFVTYKGEEYPGRHEPLVTPELFARVQTELDSHNAAGERQRSHRHYLKGTLWCGRCQDAGRESRMILQRAQGRGGEYWYFFCINRQPGICDAPYVQVDQIEAAVLRHYATITLPANFANRVRTKLDETLADQERGARLLRQHRLAALHALDTKEENLLDLAADPDVPKDKIRQRLQAIGAERQKLTEELESSQTNLAVGAAVIRSALDLLDDPAEMWLIGF